MSAALPPLAFVPQLVPKPWGGRRLETLLGKPLPADTPVGESWELADLPGHESAVRDGPHAGRTLRELVAAHGPALLGAAAPVSGRFPLLIKFLDARDDLSIQVHPKPAPDDPAGRRPGVKHEAWFILEAEPDARLYIGLRAGVTPRDVARAAGTPALVELLQAWPGRAGDCYYLPSGTLHALGRGLVVAEVQTPGDITYRAYDWDRAGLDGRPRPLHIQQVLANIRYDTPPELIRPPAAERTGDLGPATRRVACDRFLIDHLRPGRATTLAVPPGTLRIWIVLDGRGAVANAATRRDFRQGDVLLLPAGCGPARAELSADGALLDVTIPAAR